jgi:hypothetical protein
MQHRTLESFENAVIDSMNSTPQRNIMVGPTNLCTECVSAFGTDVQEEMIDEGGFSYQNCDCCGSELGGDRFSAHSLTSNNPATADIIHWDICVDCLHYLANDELPQLEG